MAHRRIWLACLGAALAAACSDGNAVSGKTGGPDAGPADILFPDAGPVATDEGRGSFTFGVATAAAQIEETTVASDWDVWTRPAPDGLGMGTFVGDAVRGYSQARNDAQLVADMNLDAYRFNVSWSRLQPTRRNPDDPSASPYDAAAIAHYDALIDTLVDDGIKPMITVHHFSSPVWVDDPRRARDAPCTPSDEDLCGWAGSGVDDIIAEIAAFAGELARRYGDRVDEWCTVNEPINYLIASYGIGLFPPGRGDLTTLLTEEGIDGLIGVMESYAKAHVAIYDAIKANDTIDADGDGVAASVGYTLSVVDWFAARDGAESELEEDVAAARSIEYVYHYVLTDGVLAGGFDRNLDGTIGPDEEHPNWAGKLDFLGVQYYFRAGVTASGGVQIARLGALPCFSGIPLASACVPAPDPTKCVPDMQYEFAEEGLYRILRNFADRYPTLPLTVTESGLATTVGQRRAEHVVRSIEQIWRAREDGVDVRGYYHWSLMDNFEWAEGYAPRFGLYSVDVDGSYARTPTEGAATLGQIAGTRMLGTAMREELGGTGPMTPEAATAPKIDDFCRKVAP